MKNSYVLWQVVGIENIPDLDWPGIFQQILFKRGY